MWRLLCLGGLLVLLQSCVNQTMRSWPDEIPEQALFALEYDDDEQNQSRQSEREYLEWVVGFYEGSLLYPTGWLDVEAVVLANATPQNREQHAQQLERLGTLLASEWAKHNAVRLIDNRLLSLWGSLLQMALEDELLTRYIDVIADDIEAVLAGQLVALEINPVRYEKILEIQLFDGF